MDVLLNGWVWIPKKDLDDFTIESLKTELTKIPRVPRDFRTEDGTDPVECYEEQDDFLGVPRQYFFDKAQKNHSVHDMRTTGHVIDQDRCAFLGATSGHERWDEQGEAVDHVRKAFASGDVGGIVQAVPAWGKCVVPSTLVAVAGKGAVEIGNIVGPSMDGEFRPIEATIASADSSYRRATWGYGKRDAEVLRLTTDAGHVLVATPEHPVMVMTDDGPRWRRLDEVYPGDPIVSVLYDLDGDPVSLDGDWGKLKIPGVMSPSLGRFLGYLVGDGNLTVDGYTRFSNGDDDVVDDVRALFADIGLDLRKVSGDNVDWRVGSVDLDRFLDWCGCGNVGAADKKVPWVVAQSGRDVVREYLRAYFEADGGTDTGSCRVEATTKSSELFPTTQFLLQGLRVASVIAPKRVQYKGTPRDFYRLRIDGEFIEAFEKEVGFLSSRKRRMLRDEIDRFKSRSRSTNRYIRPTNHLMKNLYKHVVDSDAGSRCHRSNFGAWKRVNEGGYRHYISRNRQPSTRKALDFLETFSDFRHIRWWKEIKAACDPSWWWVAVKSVERAGRSDVVDLHVPDGHSFVANGVASHNTAFAIRLICSLGFKTFIGVHKDFLTEQWKNRLEKFAPYLRVGIWKGKNVEIEDVDVVIGMIQTISKREFGSEVSDEFGLCIWDECHRVSARTWSTVPPKFNPRFHLGLSAKVRRADGMEQLFKWLIGPIIFKAKYTTPVPDIYRIPTPYMKPEWIVNYEADPTKDNLKYPTYLKSMVASQVRNKRIVDELERILRAKVGRKIVVMSERIEHLEDMATMLRERDMAEAIPDLSTGFVHSKIGKMARKDAETKRVIFTTFQMLEEGFDISALDTIVMTTARADVEQAIGRIRRECVLGTTATESDCKYYCPWRVGRCKSKPKTIVVEFVDPDVAAVMGKTKYRSRYYKEIGATLLEAKG